ncbi:uncharacterized protein [Dermacentor andersoni]|uniref:uncharacterized protein n=1 Tax=Dermacentor andersoni TaxID=34620 RepID=UPI003B3A6166
MFSRINATMSARRVWLPCILLAATAGVLTEHTTEYLQHGNFTPWKFMSSPHIYLMKTNISLGNFTCIRAATMEKNECNETMSQNISVLNFVSKTWYAFNASYHPIGVLPANTFTSVDNILNTTTNYTLYNITIPCCAVAQKSKQRSANAVVRSCELWVNDGYFQGNDTCPTASCGGLFTKYCPGSSLDVYNVTQCGLLNQTGQTSKAAP